MSISLMHVTTVPLTLGFFRGQVSYLVEHGFTVTVVSSPGPLLDRFAANEPATAVPLPMERRFSPAADLVSLVRLTRLMLARKPDLVHSHTPKAALLGTLAARLTQRKAVLSIFGLPQMTMDGAGRALLDAKTRFECALAHRVWCDSFSMRDFVVSHRLCDPAKLVVLGRGSVGGVDAMTRFNPARFRADEVARVRAAWAIPDEAIVIGYVGRMVRDKGIGDLVGAWQALRARHPHVHLLLVGEFETGDPIDPHAESLLRTDPRVHLTGPQLDVAPLFAAMDIFVMPSYREGFGVTNIEAAACGLPVVATRIPGCVDSVAEGSTGTLVPPRDPAALAEALARYVADADLRHRHGDAGRARVLEHFRPEGIWSELADLYRSVLVG